MTRNDFGRRYAARRGRAGCRRIRHRCRRCWGFLVADSIVKDGSGRKSQKRRFFGLLLLLLRYRRRCLPQRCRGSRISVGRHGRRRTVMVLRLLKMVMRRRRRRRQSRSDGPTRRRWRRRPRRRSIDHDLFFGRWTSPMLLQRRCRGSGRGSRRNSRGCCGRQSCRRLASFVIEKDLSLFGERRS